MINFDFDTIKQRILTTLSSKEEWADFMSYSATSTLLDAIVQEMVYQAQYKEYLTFENWWALARNKSSLLMESPTHGYKVPRKKGAFGEIKIGVSEDFTATHDYDILIPKFTQFSNGTIFVLTDSDNVLLAHDTDIVISCVQGERKELTFIATGAINESFYINDDTVDNDLFQVKVNNILWTEVDTLFEADSTDLVYEIETSSDLKGVYLKFGNDIFGKKLSVGDTVEFIYNSTLGIDGNIFIADEIDTVEDQLYDSEGDPIDTFVTNTTPIMGGSDFPSIEEIRNLSPKVYQTGDRATSKEDYITIVSQYNFISKINVWGVYEVNIDNNVDPWTFIPAEENLVHLAALNQYYEPLTTVQKNLLIDLIHSKVSPTDIIQFETIEKIKLHFTVTAVAENTSYTLSQVKASIISALENAYSIEYMDFYEPIYNSDFIKLIDNVDGVRNHNSSISISKEGSFSSAYLSQIVAPITPISGITFKVYIKKTTETEDLYVQLASCDANGVLTGYGTYVLDNSSVNLSNGVTTINVAYGLSDPYAEYDLKITYELETSDIILNSRYKILEYDSSDVTVTYPKS